MGIPTSLNFGSASSSPMAIYNNMLNFAQQNYQNITAGYQDVLANQRQAEAAVTAGYGNLQGNVHAMIQNVGSGQNLINQQTYAQAQASTQNQMINAGLGNTTVLGQEQLKNTGSYAIAQNTLADQIAQLQAGYYSQIGLAGLNYQGQAINADTALQAHQLDYMGNQSYPYLEGLGRLGSSMGGGGGGMSVGPMGGGAGGVAGLLGGGRHIGNIPGGNYGGGFGGGSGNMVFGGSGDSGGGGEPNYGATYAFGLGGLPGMGAALGLGSGGGWSGGYDGGGANYGESLGGGGGGGGDW